MTPQPVDFGSLNFVLQSGTDLARALYFLFFYTPCGNKYGELPVTESPKFCEFEKYVTTGHILSTPRQVPFCSSLITIHHSLSAWHHCPTSFMGRTGLFIYIFWDLHWLVSFLWPCKIFNKPGP